MNYLLPFYKVPGSDDDGTGSVAILQVLRSLMEQQFVPPTGIRIEVHWYAAEEGSLFGSHGIVSIYEEEGKSVRGLHSMHLRPFVQFLDSTLHQ
jgi:leucyl aminopeptidase